MQLSTSLLTKIGVKTLGAIRPFLAPLYRMVPANARSHVRTTLANWVLRSSRLEAGRNTAATSDLRAGITLIGYPRAQVGMGEALRMLAQATKTAGTSVEAFDLGATIAVKGGDDTIDHMLTVSPSSKVNVLCVNVDMLAETLLIIGSDRLAGRVNIVRPFWELPKLPNRWDNALSIVDEVWAPTRFVQEAFDGRAASIRRIPMAVSRPVCQPVSRSRFGLPSDAYLFCFCFDFASYVTRKNPLGVVRAFHMAFADIANRNVAVRIKMTGDGPGRMQAIAKLKPIQHRDSRIHLIYGGFSRTEIQSLIACCDCYVSLHRSEGFGLTVAEAMAFAKPVISTDYSGTTDFVNSSNGFPVPFHLVNLKAGEYPYFEVGQCWAEPDLKVAAEYMSFMFTRPEEGRRVGELGQAHVLRQHSPELVGRLVSERLKEIFS